MLPFLYTVMMMPRLDIYWRVCLLLRLGFLLPVLWFLCGSSMTRLVSIFTYITCFRPQDWSQFNLFQFHWIHYISEDSSYIVMTCNSYSVCISSVWNLYFYVSCRNGLFWCNLWNRFCRWFNRYVLNIISDILKCFRQNIEKICAYLFETAIKLSPTNTQENQVPKYLHM